MSEITTHFINTLDEATKGKGEPYPLTPLHLMQYESAEDAPDDWTDTERDELLDAIKQELGISQHDVKMTAAKPNNDVEVQSPRRHDVSLYVQAMVSGNGGEPIQAYYLAPPGYKG